MGKVEERIFEEGGEGGEDKRVKEVKPEKKVMEVKAQMQKLKIRFSLQLTIDKSIVEPKAKIIVKLD
jgi:hypothetical protein